MSVSERATSSMYLEWAKLRSVAPYNLATSGVMSYPLAGLPVSMADLEINGATIYGYAPLQERLAALNGVAVDRVVATNGTSMANHLAMAAMLSAGDEVLIEEPTYGLLLEVISYLGAKAVRFSRDLERGFAIDVEEIRGRVSGKTKLIVLTNLHNPSGALIGESVLREVGEIARGVGARVLVDEVYLEMVGYETGGPAPRTAALLGDEFVVTNSLTKAYGLSGIRCGWILAEPELAKRIWRLNDLFNATPVHVGELIAVAALDHLGVVRERAKGLLGANREAMQEFVNARKDLEVYWPEAGSVVFPRLRRGSVEEFCALLRERYETSVVPGRFFERAQHFRAGLGGDVAMTAEGLRRLGMALDEYGRG